MRGLIVLTFVVFLFGINFASAYYVCSDNTNLIHDSDELKTGQIRILNSLSVGLGYASERTATSRIEAIIIVDAWRVNLTNGTSSFGGKFTDGSSYSARLVNITAEGTTLKIGSNTKLFDIGETHEVDGKQVSLLSSQRISQTEMNAEIIIGKNGSYLSTDGTLYAKFKIDSKNYLVSLLGVSGSDATIRVSKCENSSLNIIETSNNNQQNINENASEEPDNNSNVVNNTGEANQSSDGGLNESENISDVEYQNGEGVFSDQKVNKLLNIGTYIGAGLTIVVIIFIIFKYIQRRRETAKEIKSIEYSKKD